MPSAGDLRWRVQLLERNKQVTRKSGFVPSDYVPWPAMPAEGEPAKIDEGIGTEASSHGSMDASLGIMITIRYDLPRRPTTDDCVTLLDGTNRVCNIIGVRDPIGNRRWLELICRASA